MPMSDYVPSHWIRLREFLQTLSKPEGAYTNAIKIDTICIMEDFGNRTELCKISTPFKDIRDLTQLASMVDAIFTIDLFIVCRHQLTHTADSWQLSVWLMPDVTLLNASDMADRIMAMGEQYADVPVIINLHDACDTKVYRAYHVAAVTDADGIRHVEIDAVQMDNPPKSRDT